MIVEIESIPFALDVRLCLEETSSRTNEMLYF